MNSYSNILAGISVKFPFVKFPMCNVYLPNRLKARAPKAPNGPSAGTPAKLLNMDDPEQIAPVAPHIQLAAKQVLETKLLAHTKFVAALPVVQILSAIIKLFANDGAVSKTELPASINLVAGVGAKSNAILLSFY